MTNKINHHPTRYTATYNIKMKGFLDGGWQEWDGEMAVSFDNTDEGPPVTILTAALEQGALQGTLRWLDSLRLPLISVICIDYS